MMNLGPSVSLEGDALLTQSSGLDATPLKKPEHGRWLALQHDAYHAGQSLVLEHGLKPQELMWDADEILWDWAMSGSRLLSHIPRAAFGNFSHTEWLVIRPGMLELLWGIRHAAEALGIDPDMRIWTSGYPWRLWEIIQRVPGMLELLGGEFLPRQAYGQPVSHSHVFTRLENLEVLQGLLDDEDYLKKALASMPEAARHVISRHLKEKPQRSGLKIPELALLAGRDAFSDIRILVDDSTRNTTWFHESSRSAVRVTSITPTILGGIPNSAWKPRQFLESVRSLVVFEIAEALSRLSKADEAILEEIAVDPASAKEAELPPMELITLKVPSKILWNQWLHPARALARSFKHPKKKIS